MSQELPTKEHATGVIPQTDKVKERARLIAASNDTITYGLLWNKYGDKRIAVDSRKNVKRLADRWLKGDRADLNAKWFAPDYLPVDDLDAVYEATREAAKVEAHNFTFLYGKMTKMCAERREHGMLVERKTKGSQSTFHDPGQHIHYVDIDGLQLDIDGREPLPALADELRKVLPEELAKTSFVVFATGSHGTVRSGNVAPCSLRLIFWMEEPTTIETFGHYITAVAAPHIEEKTGQVKKLDTSFYVANRLVLVLPPNTGEYDGTPYQHERVYLSEAENYELNIGDADELRKKFLKFKRRYRGKGTTPRNIRKSTEYNTDGGRNGIYVPFYDMVLEQRPGNTHEPLRDGIFDIVRNQPKRKQADYITHFVRQMADQIRRTSDTPESAEQRIMEHLSPAEIDRLVKGARERIDTVQVGVEPIETTEKPHSWMEGDDQDSGRARVRRINRRFFDGVRSNKQRFILQAGDTGSSKTSDGSTRAVAPDIIKSHRVALMSSTIGLTTETFSKVTAKLLEANKHDLASNVIQWHGRETICKDLNPRFNELHKQLSALGAPNKDLCKKCPKSNVCKWLQQYERIGPQFTLGQHAHSATYEQSLSKDSDHAHDGLILDENPISSFLNDDEPSRLIDDIVVTPDDPQALVKWGDDDNKRTSIVGTNDLIAFSDQLFRILNRTVGPVRMDELKPFAEMVTTKTKAGTEAKTRIELAIKSARGWSWRLIQDIVRWGDKQVDAPEDMTEIIDKLVAGKKTEHNEAAELYAALQKARFNLKCFQAIKNNLDIGRTEATINLNVWTKGKQRRVYCSKLTPLPKYVQHGSTMIYDATAQRLPMEAFIAASGIDHTKLEFEPAPIERGPYTLIQYPDKPYGKRNWTSEGDYKNSNIRVLMDCIVTEAKQAAIENRPHDCVGRNEKFKIDVLVLVTKELEDKILNKFRELAGLKRKRGETPKEFIHRLKSEGTMPTNIAIEHWGNTRGLDCYKDAPTGIFVGRDAPSCQALEADAEAIAVHHPDIQSIQRMPRDLYGNTGYFTAPRTLALTNGSYIGIDAEAHPDPFVEQYRKMIVDGEVIQAIGRLRLPNRTYENPARIIVFGQTDTKLQIDELRRWEDIEVTALDAMQDIGVVFQQADMIQRAYPGFVPNAKIHATEAAKSSWDNAVTQSNTLSPLSQFASLSQTSEPSISSDPIVQQEHSVHNPAKNDPNSSKSAENGEFLNVTNSLIYNISQFDTLTDDISPDTQIELDSPVHNRVCDSTPGEVGQAAGEQGGDLDERDSRQSLRSPVAHDGRLLKSLGTVTGWWREVRFRVADPSKKRRRWKHALVDVWRHADVADTLSRILGAEIDGLEFVNVDEIEPAKPIADRSTVNFSMDLTHVAELPDNVISFGQAKAVAEAIKPDATILAKPVVETVD